MERDAAASDAVGALMPRSQYADLDRTTWPEVREQILDFTHDGPLGEPRVYPGYPCWPLIRCRPRPWQSLEKILWTRRCVTNLKTQLPDPATLSRVLQFSHGITAENGRGPTPSAGSLQAIELYLVNFTTGWLPTGAYHYDRGGHSLAQLVAGAERDAWRAIAPSFQAFDGGALLWIIVGDTARVRQKYADRAERFLMLEAGHLMQNLCLMSHRVGWTTVPLGAFFEHDIGRALALPTGDTVMYTGLLGKTAVLEQSLIADASS
jgi:SagB-type dehydrogenase family enzyme